MLFIIQVKLTAGRLKPHPVNQVDVRLDCRRWRARQRQSAHPVIIERSRPLGNWQAGW